MTDHRGHRHFTRHHPFTVDHATAHPALITDAQHYIPRPLTPGTLSVLAPPAPRPQPTAEGAHPICTPLTHKDQQRPPHLACSSIAPYSGPFGGPSGTRPAGRRPSPASRPLETRGSRSTGSARAGGRDARREILARGVGVSQRPLKPPRGIALHRRDAGASAAVTTSSALR